LRYTADLPGTAEPGRGTLYGFPFSGGASSSFARSTAGEISLVILTALLLFSGINLLELRRERKVQPVAKPEKKRRRRKPEMDRKTWSIWSSN
jgi:hypothetical protein